MGSKGFSVTAGKGGHAVVKEERYRRDKGWEQKESANRGREGAGCSGGGAEGPSALRSWEGEWKWRSVKVTEARAVETGKEKEKFEHQVLWDAL